MGELALPLFLVIGVACALDAARSELTRPTAAFLIVLWASPTVILVTFVLYALGVRVPNLVAGMAIGWPQLLFFGLSLFWDSAGGYGAGGYVLFSEHWAATLTVVFWALVAILFSWTTRRVKRFPVLLGLALTTVLAIVFVIYEIAPLLNWKFEFDAP